MAFDCEPRSRGRAAAALVTSLLVFAACSPAAGAVTAAQRRAWAETRAQCPALANLDFARLGADDDTWRGQARQLLRASDQPQLGDTDMVIRFYAPPGFGGSASTWTLARRVAGAWRFRREEQTLPPAMPAPPDPHVIDMRARRTQSPIVVTEGPLESQRAEGLEAALADPCLAREPDSASAVLSLRDNHDQACMDGATFLLQIERAEGVRTFAHVCATHWRAGEIMRALESAHVTTTTYLTPLILVDAQNNNVPQADAPPPRTLTVVGDLGAPAMSFSINGAQVFEGARGAGDATWQIYPPIGGSPVSLEFRIEGCATPLIGELGEGQTTICVHGCGLQLD